MAEEATSKFLDGLTALGRKLRTQFNARVTAHGLTYPRARVLLRLARHGAMAQKALACELELEQPTLVRLLDRMAELELIRRTEDPDDRRSKLVSLTEYGQVQADLVTRIGADMRHEIFAGISPEDLRQTNALFECLSQRLSGIWDEPHHD